MTEAVMHVIDRELYLGGHTRSDLARHLGVNRSTVKRRMESSFSDYEGGLDGMVEAASAILDRPPIEIWEAALKVWANAIKLKGGDDARYWKRLRDQRSALVKKGPSTDVLSPFFSALANVEQESQPTPPADAHDLATERVAEPTR